MISESSTDPRRRRVPALAPDERRAALVASTIPLLRLHGTTVSTRQIANAAGVAEGTIFNAFPDKASLIRAAVISAFDPEPIVRALGEIDPRTGLRPRLEGAAALLARRFAENGPLMPVIFGTAPGVAPPDDFRAMLDRARRRIIEALAEVIEPDGSMLRRSPTITARVLFTALSANRGPVDDVDRVEPVELVELLLDGLLVRPLSDRATGEADRC